LRGSGAAATVASVAVGEGLAAEGDSKSVVVKGTTSMVLNVNGKDYTVKVEPRTTLLDVLRFQFALTGAKPISQDASSGGSTVLVDGKPMSASTILALQARGKKIRTVESLGGAKPDPVPLAFAEHDAQQCGFCTPGFVVAVRAFLDKNPRATNEQIRHSGAREPDLAGQGPGAGDRQADRSPGRNSQGDRHCQVRL
jgi:aerobic-type carbon monoxide dehydrogenase small subunit (CoxS/CutS family)